jgi:glycosyltransferase involved in cell wall biosynthesis
MYSSSFTGIGRYTYELVKGLVRETIKNQKNNHFVLFFNEPQFAEFDSEGLIKEVADQLDKKAVRLPKIKKVLVNARHYSFREQWHFYRLLKREKLDTVHFPHFNVPILYRRPYTVTIHDMTLSFFPGKKMRKWYHRLAYHLTIKNAVFSAKKIIAVSEHTKKDIVKHCKVDPDKIVTIYNGVNKDFTLIDDASGFQKTLNKHEIKGQFLLYTGVWRSHKNLTTLIEAMAILKDKHALDYRLVITGKEDPNYPEVKEAVEKFSLKNDVIFTGLVSEEELITLYNAAFIYTFPSFYEGFGLPPLEAMKCGTPVVVSEASCLPEVCGRGNALFFNPRDPQELAAQISKIHHDPDLQTQLIERGLKWASDFTWQKMAEKSFKVITNV